MESRIPEDELEKSQTKKVLLDPKKSRFAKKAKTKEEFEQRASKTSERMQGNLAEAFELGKEYRDLLADKTISENKTFLTESREKEIVGKLINYAVKVNTDVDEYESMGSVALLTLLLKCVIKMRDRYNDIEYKYHMLEKNHARLEEKFNSLSSRVSQDETK
jgi:hypothetical protein